MCQTQRQRDMSNAKSRTCTWCHPERTTNGMTHWRAVCGESRKHGSEGAVGKVFKGNSLAAYPTMEQYTESVEGQNDGQETAATHAGLQVATVVHPLKSTSCSGQSRTHPLGCPLFFQFPWSSDWGQP